MLHILPKTFEIIDKKVVIITSAIRGKSTFTPQERFEQTKNSIKSVRIYLPEYSVVLVEMLYLEEKEIEELTSLCEYVIYCGEHKGMQRYNDPLNPSLGEILLLTAVLSSLVNPISVFKLSGRYEINNWFRLSELDLEKYVFVENPPEKAYYTTLYHIPEEEIKNFIHILEKAFLAIMNDKGWLGIEKCLYSYLDTEKIQVVKIIGCHGYVAGRYGGEKGQKSLCSV